MLGMKDDMGLPLVPRGSTSKQIRAIYPLLEAAKDRIAKEALLAICPFELI